MNIMSVWQTIIKWQCGDLVLCVKPKEGCIPGKLYEIETVRLGAYQYFFVLKGQTGEFPDDLFVLFKSKKEQENELKAKQQLKDALEANEALNNLAKMYGDALENIISSVSQTQKQMAKHLGTTNPVSLNELSQECYRTSKEKGWYDDESADNVITKLCLIHSEISEALEEIRNGKELGEIYYNSDKPEKPEGFVVEIADALIRIFDLCGRFNLDIENAVKTKMEYNKTRPYRHGGKKC